MKTICCYLLILLHASYLTNCDEETVKVNGLSGIDLRQLAKIARVTHNSAGNANPVRVAEVANPVRLARGGTSRQSRVGDEPARNVSEEVIARDESEKLNRSSQGEKNAVQPGRRDATGKRKQPAKLTIPAKPAITEGTPKPTKYHYYPHNQHVYLLPECAIQQVCNAVYVRLNYTQPLCACPSRKEPCSASLNADDLHTTELVTASTGKVLTLVKTCEPVAEMRICRAPRDWSLLALQNVRTGKSHYLVICRCPHKGRLEGPMSHDQPAYASVPGIRVYGMMCVRDSYRISRPFRYRRSATVSGRRLQFPWDKVKEFQSTVEW